MEDKEKRPTFSLKQYREIAKMLGRLEEKDELVEVLTRKFGMFFLRDNPKFDFRRFQSAVTREREGAYRVCLKEEERW